MIIIATWIAGEKPQCCQSRDDVFNYGRRGQPLLFTKQGPEDRLAGTMADYRMTGCRAYGCHLCAPYAVLPKCHQHTSCHCRSPTSSEELANGAATRVSGLLALWMTVCLAECSAVWHSSHILRSEVVSRGNLFLTYSTWQDAQQFVACPA